MFGDAQQQQHEMILEGTQPSGADEWFCPTCGRRIVMRPPPNYQKVVLDPGDEMAVHVGGKGGVRVGQFSASPSNTTPADEANGDELAWRRWLHDNGIAWEGPAA
jgi:hypothetical protein